DEANRRSDAVVNTVWRGQMALVSQPAAHGRRRAPERPTEGSDERLVRGVAGLEGQLGDRRIARAKVSGRALQPQPSNHLPDGFAQQRLEHPVKVKPREANVISEIAQVDRLVQMLDNVTHRGLDPLLMLQSRLPSHRAPIMGGPGPCRLASGCC